jgi:GAF domain-containing protein
VNRSRLAWSLLGLCVLELVVAGVLFILARKTGEQSNWGSETGGAVLLFGSLVYPVVGALLASRRVGGAIGWICLAVGLAVGFVALTDAWAKYALETNPGTLPAGRYAAWFSNWSWPVFVGLIAIYLVLLFPTGSPPTPRWRWVARLAGAAIGLASLAFSVAPGNLEDSPVPVQNPLGIGGIDAPLTVVAFSSLMVMFGCIVAAIVSMVVRFRRSRGTERQQLRWFATATLFTGVLFFISVVSTPLFPTAIDNVVQSVALISFLTLPVAMGIAILKYRLYDLDVVINKTVVYAALAAFITALYVGIVVGIGALFGSAGNVYLSILATAVVALAFQPARSRAQRLANRLVYGKRATPYEVLADFSEHVARSVAAEEVLPRMAQTVAAGTGATTSEVWLRSGSTLRLAAAWPDPPTASVLTLANGRLPEFPSADRAVEVRHQDELLGALAIVKPPGEALAPIEEKLLSDVASQAGLVLRNARLTSELLARLEELQASRQRLVAAQDEERRRLERNLHDGAQQHLVALKVKLNLAARRAQAAAAPGR